LDFLFQNLDFLFILAPGSLNLSGAATRGEV
jgi:hypothetical protein